MRKRVLLLCLLAVALPAAASAQQTDTSVWRFGMSAGSSFEAGFGRSQSSLWAAPHLSWQPSQQLTLHAGVAAEASLSPLASLHGPTPKSLAPRKQGTRMATLWGEASYHPSDRLHLWASLAHTAGQLQPLWLNRAAPLSATAFSAGLGYQFPNGNLLELDFHFVHDRYATLPDAFGPLPYSYPFPYPYPYSHPFYHHSPPYPDYPF